MQPVELQQVITNLVLNARQAMLARRGGRLSIQVSREQRGMVIIRVSDTGPGIDKQLLPRVFDPFVTQRAGDGAAGEGTGLGLAICRELVEAVGGTIEVEQTSSQGTVFRVDLPAA